MLHVVTATLNGRDHTERLIYSVMQLPAELPARVVLVDNGSIDDTLGWVHTLRTRIDGQDYPLVPGAIQVIANAQNLGAASAWNFGIRLALMNGATAVLVAGNDTCPQPGTIVRLFEQVTRGIPFITGTQVPYDAPDAPVTNASPNDPLLMAPDFSFFMLTPQTVELVARADAQREFERQKQTPSATLHMNPWEWGLFDSRYWPAYFEDNDYHWRLLQAGLIGVRDPGAFFRHDCSYTLRTSPDIGRVNEQTFRANGELFRQKWGALPHELGMSQAQPLNVSDAQWDAMTGGRPIAAIPAEQVTQQAVEVYRRHGLLR